MEKFLEQLKTLNAIRMDAAEKARIRTEVIRYMAAHPTIERTPFFAAVSMQRVFAPVGVAALLLFTGGTASLAAEAALPGEPLYSMKVRFNEPVLGALAVSEVKKAAWEARVAERRLEEADTLAMSGRLDVETNAKIEANFEDYANRATEKIAALSDKDAVAAAELSARFESSLKAHANILAKLDVKEDAAPAEDAAGIAAMSLKALPEPAEPADLDTPNAKLRVKIEKVIGTLARARDEKSGRPVVDSSPRPSVAVAAEGKVQAATNAIAAARRAIARDDVSLGAEPLAAARVRLTAAETLLVEARLKLSAGAYNDAFILANRAIRTAEETRVLARAQVEKSRLTIVEESESGRSSTTSQTIASVNFLEIPRGSEGEYGMIGAGSAAATGIAVDPATTTATSSATSSEASSTIKLNVDGELKVDD